MTGSLYARGQLIGGAILRPRAVLWYRPVGRADWGNLALGAPAEARKL